MISKDEAKKKIQSIIDEFEVKKSYYFKADEAEIETKLIEPLFEALGWTKSDFEKRPKVQRENKRGIPDYAFKINGRIVFFLEAKKVSVDIDKDKDTWKQATSYALSKRIPFAVLTDFEGIKVFCVEQENALTNQFRDLKYKEYITRFEDLWLLSKESFKNNYILEMAVREQRLKRRKSIDSELLEDLMHIRKLLADNIERNHPQKYTSIEKDEIIQRILDRLIFIRKAEDIGINRNNIILKELSGFPDSRIHAELKKVFKIYDEDYNSGLFLQGQDNDCDSIQLDGKIIRELLELLYESRNKNYIYNFDWIDADVLGQVYEQYLGIILQQTKGGTSKLKEGQSHRKGQGIYYTPTYIVDFIVRNTLGEMLKDKNTKFEKIRILDPACGSGSFLIKAFDLLNEYCVKKSKDYAQKTFDLSGITFSTKEKILKNNIFGVDLDNKAVEIAQLNLLLKIAEKGHKLPLLKENIKSGNSLIDNFEVADTKAFKWDDQFSDIMKEGGFDVIIGNPPYIFSREKIKSSEKDYYTKNYETTKYQVNTYVLFIERSIKLLKPDGRLGFIVPDAWLRVESVGNLRKYIIDNCLLEKIIHIRGETFHGVGVESSIFILKKSRKPGKTQICTNFSKLTYKEVSQMEWLRNPNFEIDIFLDNEKSKIIKKVEKDTKLLDDVSNIKAGLQAYEKGKGKPKQTSSDVKNRPYDYNYKKDQNTYKYLEGKDVNRYSHSWKNSWLSYGEWLAAPRTFNLFGSPRILVREIPSRPPYAIIAAYLEDTYLNNRSIINILKKDKSVELKYILAILNSKVMTFYHMNKSVKAQRNLFPKVTLNDMRRFPIKIISIDKQKEIIALVDRLIFLNQRLGEIGDKRTDDKNKLEEEINRTNKKIDNFVYDIYGLSDSEKNIIEENLE